VAKKTTKKTARRAPARRKPALDDLPEGDPTPAPIALDAVLGQPGAINNLRRSIGSGRVHHAWIFFGPHGVGKLTAALAFAGVLLDPTSEPGLTGEIAPDPDSVTQRMLREGVHPDLHLITKELARFSDEKNVRDAKLITIPKDVIETRLLKPAYLAPTSEASLGARVRKVFIVDEAHLMDRSASNAVVQNAVLKTLEEPPEGTVIILVTDHEDRLLPTIRSRCQRVGFGPLDDGAMHAWLREAEVDAPARDREWLLAFAAGSPGRFLEAAEAGLADWARRLDPMLRLADGGTPVAELGPAMTSLVEAWAKDQVKKDDRRSKEAANRQGAAFVFAVLAARARDLLRDGSDPDHGLRMVEAIAEAERRLAANVSLAGVFEWLSAVLSAPAGLTIRTG
jgi:DNA polymerase-3 subunit delta'